jgi:outer membrane protein assembly factor BamB
MEILTHARRRYFALATVAILLQTSCGGAIPSFAEPKPSDDAQGIILEGRIEFLSTSPQQANLTNIRFATNKSPQDSSGIKGHVYTFSGKDLGSFTTDAEGYYSLETPVENLSDDSTDASNATVIVAAENGIQHCTKVPVGALTGPQEAGIDLGTADVSTTLATESIANGIDGFSGWGNNYSTKATESDHLDCLYRIEKSLWESADRDAVNLNGDYGWLKAYVEALLAQGKDHAALGFDSWHSLFSGILNGSADAFLTLDSIGVATLELNGGKPALDDYENATEVRDSVGKVLSALTNENHDSESEEWNVCDSVVHGELDPAVLTAPLLEAESLEDFQLVYGHETAAAVHVGLIKECIKSDHCNDVKDHAASVLSFLKEYEGDYSKLYDASTGDLDETSLKGIVAAAKICDNQGSGKQNDCVKEKHAEIYASGMGWDAILETDGSESAKKVQICHIPPGNPANAHTIEIAAAGVPAHLAHGDSEGECEAQNPEEQNDPPTQPNAIQIETDGVVEEIKEEEAEEAGEEETAPFNPPFAVEPSDEVEEPVGDIEPAAQGDSVEDEIHEEGLSELWNYEFGHVYGGFYRMIPGPSAAIGDMRPDLSGLEVATGNEEYYPIGFPGPSGRWFLFQADGTVVFWKDTTNDEAHSSINLYDLDDDGVPEMLGGTTSGNQVQAFNGNGDWTWRYILEGHSIATPAVAPLHSGGVPQVYGGSFDYYIRSINGVTGKLNWRFYTGRQIWSSAAVADLDGDGRQEVVVASDASFSGQKGVLFCLDAETGTENWRHEFGTASRASAALADLDGDGVREVLIGDNDGTFYAFSGKTGALEWSFHTGGKIVSSAAVGDLDGDGDLETVFGSGDGSVYALNGDGSEFWSHEFGAAVHSSPTLARRTSAGRLDVYVGTMGGEVAVLNGTDGTVIASASVEYEIVSSPVAGDVDGDGKLEIFFQDRRGDFFGMQGDVFWSLRDEGSDVAPFTREWPVFRANPAHTGVYGDSL